MMSNDTFLSHGNRLDGRESMSSWLKSTRASNYDLILRDDSSCIYDYGQIFLGKTDPVKIDSVFTINESCCGLDGQIIVYADDPGAVVKYSIDTLYSSQDSSQFDSLFRGDYLIHIQDINDCIDSVEVHLSVDSTPSINMAIGITDIVCYGDTNGTLKVYYPDDCYLADTQFIDGLALSPAAFGSFDSAGNWNPKEFALPTPNDGTTWSGNFTGDAIDSSYPATYAFDGTEGDSTHRTRSNANNATIHWGGSSDLEIEYKTSIRVKHWHNGNIKVNDVEKVTTTAGSDPEWITVIDGESGTLNKLSITSTSGQKLCLYAIEIDGVMMKDGKTDPSTRSNPNVGITWSDNLTSASGWYGSPHGADKAFDGSPDTGNVASTSNNNSTITFAPTTPITVNSTISIYERDSNFQGSVAYNYVLDGVTKTFTHADTARWVHFTEFAGKTISNSTPFTITRQSGSGDETITYFAGIKVDGHLLVDSTFDNSFHLKFDNTPTNGAIGTSSIGAKIDNANGGLPIYNTSDDYGHVKGSGNRTDSLSSNLKFALPGDVIDGDVSSSDHTVTKAGSILDVSTSHSRFYGSAIDFGAGANSSYLQLPDHADFEFGTGDFCIEAWVRITSAAQASNIWCQRNGSHEGVSFMVTNARKLQYFNDSNVERMLFL